ncbi:MAG: hypothetical protein OK456_06290 [Thaumarchaeota archaeon]|nr:hypothetical protein [Nitrososphaerota archaeon]
MSKEKSLDNEILQLWKELSPSGAYLQGWDEYAGKLFVPSTENLARAVERVRALRRRAENEVQAKVLDSMEVVLLFPEPQPVLDEIVGTIFGHLTKEGVNTKHLSSLISNSSKAIDATQKRFKNLEIPVAVKALTLYRLDGVLEILAAVKGETKDKSLQRDCDRLAEKVRKFVAMFELEGFGSGTFEEVEKVFKKHRFDLGRKDFYRAALEAGFDYSESPDELEKKALGWIDEELPKYRDIVGRLAKHYKCPATPEAVQKKIEERQKLKPRDLLRITNSIRKVVQEFMDESVVRINKHYKTRVIETPPYLSGTLPTAAASFFDTFTKKPFQIYFLTTDPRRDPAKSISQLLDLLVHEEYGHCVNNSNSVFRFGGRATDLELMYSLLNAPITEGLSFNREREFLEASLALEHKKDGLTKAERGYVAILEKFGGFKLVNMEIEFEVRKWRLIRFLRVIGDVRINTGRQGLFEFIDWAHKHTGVPRSNVFYQLFPAHEGMFPGYATTYAVVGEEIRTIENRLEDPKKRIKFSTYLTGIGYPPRSIYRKRLEDFASSL